MSLALEVIGLRKRFTAGVGSCLATHAVLRGVDLELERGEAVAIVGATGSGRSTFLLCIAGLLIPEEGVVRHFGDESREAGIRNTRYYLNVEQLSMHGRAMPSTHLLDLRDFSALELEGLRRWLGERSAQGDAAIMVVDSVDLARHLVTRVLVLREGRLAELPRAQARVAEARFVDRPSERV